MKYTVSVFLIATVLLAGSRAAPVPLSDDLLLDDDYLEDVVGSVLPEVDVDLSSDSDRATKHPDTDHSSSSSAPNVLTGNTNGGNHQYVAGAACPVCYELKGGVCKKKNCPLGQTCSEKNRKNPTIPAGTCGR